jgi:hypothetical protein
MEELSDAEREIVSNAQAGVPTFWEQPSKPKVRASVVRELCLNSHWKLTPKGVEVHGATLTGALDLNWVTLTCPLVFENCTFDCAVSAADSVVPTLSFRDCQLKGLDAPRIQTKGILDLTKLNCMGRST